jgi:hypothetical protein
MVDRKEPVAGVVLHPRATGSTLTLSAGGTQQASHEAQAMNSDRKTQGMGVGLGLGFGIALGAGLGAAFGAAFDNIGVGVAFGVGIGVAIAGIVDSVRSPRNR